MKRVENEVLQTLKGEIDFLLNQVDELDRALAKNVSQIHRHEHLVTGAYHLSCIYSCLEDIFSKIARVFENRVENPASWHKELLERMRITVPEVRPAVLRKDAFLVLDEIRGFRHVFRSSYVFSLDGERVLTIAKKWNGHKKEILSDIGDFLKEIGRKR